MTKVLLIEDDPLVAKVILYYLEQAETYETTWARSGGEALAHAREYFDVILLDILLPDADGVELCARLRNWQACPILFVSCLDNSDTIVKALEMGGDDFITKPFDNKMLEARIQASLRRFRQQGQPAVRPARCGGFSLDPAERTVGLPGGGQARLSATEYRILSFLMDHVGQCFTTRELYVRIWGRRAWGTPAPWWCTSTTCGPRSSPTRSIPATSSSGSGRATPLTPPGRRSEGLRQD